MDHSENKKQVKCPQCGRLTFYTSENKFRPFCSHRCRLIDLGQWADGTYKIPLKPQDGYQYDLNINENPVAESISSEDGSTEQN